MLVIIDIQDCYHKDFNKMGKSFYHMLENLKDRISLAAERKETVINLSHFESGQTVSDLINPIREANGFLINKKEWDGSPELIQAIQEDHLHPEEIELTGVFRNICVLETWKGLKAAGFPVKSIKKELTLETPKCKKDKIYPEGYL